MRELFDNGFSKLYQSDARELPIPDNSVDCVVTSPPYWGLRDYGTGEWVGGDDHCNHIANPNATKTMGNPVFNENRPSREATKTKGYYEDQCPKCGAKRIDEQIGIEKTPEEYCTNMVKVFREVWRVLKPTGTVWLNLGDSYASGSSGERISGMNERTGRSSGARKQGLGDMRRAGVDSLKPKDLVGIPWRVAFALQADGWYLRSDIIWSKPNPMPESVTDRPTKAHEYVFLLTKSPRYYYDADAIREPASNAGAMISLGEKSFAKRQADGANVSPSGNGLSDTYTVPSHRNKRTVWEIATQPYSEAHFATYPQKLVEPCILSGTSEKGVCAECGKPWERITDKERTFESGSGRSGVLPHGKNGYNLQGGGKTVDIRRGPVVKVTTIDWQPTCTCNADTVPATVLDPFVGSGTTLLVAQKLGRKSIGVDLNDEYLEMAQKRLESMPIPMLLTT
jgi:DNA modification methylase